MEWRSIPGSMQQVYRWATGTAVQLRAKGAQRMTKMLKASGGGEDEVRTSDSQSLVALLVELRRQKRGMQAPQATLPLLPHHRRVCLTEVLPLLLLSNLTRR